MSDFGMGNIDRGILGHPLFRDEAFTEREAWIWMFLSAVKKSGKRRIAAHSIDLARGQLAYSHRFMSARFKWSVSSVQRYLQKLTDEKMIEVATVERITRITILNYDKYQGSVTEFEVAESGVTGSQVNGSQVAESQNESSPGRQHLAASDYKRTTITGPPTLDESKNESPAGQIRETLSSDSRDSVVDVGVARARESFSIAKETYQLADDVMQTLGIDLAFVPPPWMGFAMWLQTGLNGGWRPELVRIAAARIRARKNYSLPFKYTYLEKPIQREHIDAAHTHLPIPPVVVSNNQGHSHAAESQVHTATTWQGSRDAFRAARAKLKQALDEPAAEDGSAGGRSVVRLAPAAGRRQP